MYHCHQRALPPALIVLPEPTRLMARLAASLGFFALLLAALPPRSSGASPPAQASPAALVAGLAHASPELQRHWARYVDSRDRLDVFLVLDASAAAQAELRKALRPFDGRETRAQARQRVFDGLSRAHGDAQRGLLARLAQAGLRVEPFWIVCVAARVDSPRELAAGALRTGRFWRVMVSRVAAAQQCRFCPRDAAGAARHDRRARAWPGAHRAERGARAHRAGGGRGRPAGGVRVAAECVVRGPRCSGVARSTLVGLALADGEPLWNVKLIRAPEAWETTRGEGVTLANIDTGVHWTHETLQPGYRGWRGDDREAMHDYNWFDPLEFRNDTCVALEAAVSPALSAAL